MNLMWIALGLGLLILGGNYLLKAAVSFSLRLQIPKIVIGMTVVSFATSAPELIVSVQSALQGHADLALGNVVGSNIANIGLVLGITVLLSSIRIKRTFYTTDWSFMMFSSILLYVFIAFDQVLQAYEGMIFVLLLIGFLIYLFKFHKLAVLEEVSTDSNILSRFKTLLFFTLGGVFLWAGSELLIYGAVGTAHYFGVSKRIIALSIVSIATSIPELSASVISVLKDEKGISIGNLIGSNIFNILAVLGITSIITPVEVVDAKLIVSDLYWMLGFAFLMLPLCLLFSRDKLGKFEGVLLLVLYTCFIYSIIY